MAYWICETVISYVITSFPMQQQTRSVKFFILKTKSLTWETPSAMF